MEVSERYRFLLVSKFAPGGGGADEPYYAGEWRDAFELGIALCRAGHRAELACPAVLPRHRSRVLAEVEPLAGREGLPLHFGQAVFNHRASWTSTWQHTAHWLGRYRRLRPDVVVFTQARYDPGLRWPGAGRRAVATTCEPELFLPGGRRLPPVPGLAARLSPAVGPRRRTAERLAGMAGRLFNRVAFRGPVHRYYPYIGLLVPPPAGREAELDPRRYLPLYKGMNPGIPESVAPAPERRDFLFCGAVSENKGLFTLLEAFGRLPRPARLAVIGSGPHEEVGRLREAAAALPGVELLGSQGFVSKFAHFRSAGALVLPTRRDYYPSVILEALACGLPVVTSEHIVSPVEHEVSGLLVPPDDPEALAAALGRLLEEPGLRKRLAAGARRAAAGLTWDRAVASLAGLAGRLRAADGRA